MQLGTIFGGTHLPADGTSFLTLWQEIVTTPDFASLCDILVTGRKAQYELHFSLVSFYCFVFL